MRWWWQCHWEHLGKHNRNLTPEKKDSLIGWKGKQESLLNVVRDYVCTCLFLGVYFFSAIDILLFQKYFIIRPHVHPQFRKNLANFALNVGIVWTNSPCMKDVGA